MSDDWIILIPEDPRFVPDGSRQFRAKLRLVELAPEAHEITAEESDTVRFLDCGGNFERILCPSCGSEVPIEWWQERMGDDFADGFLLRTYEVPCCSRCLTLQELVYIWPQGFGRFTLSAMNPNLGKLNDTHKNELENILGTPLRVIYRHI